MSAGCFIRLLRDEVLAEWSSEGGPQHCTFHSQLCRPRHLLRDAGWYIRLLRDEVLAEWSSEGSAPVLHVYCHVSGQERWLAPPQLRNYIFKREMPLVSAPSTLLTFNSSACSRHQSCDVPSRQTAFALAVANRSLPFNPWTIFGWSMPLMSFPMLHKRDLLPASDLQVLDTLAWAERGLLAAFPEYADARVFVHLNSSLQVRVPGFLYPKHPTQVLRRKWEAQASSTFSSTHFFAGCHPVKRRSASTSAEDAPECM